MLKIGQDLIDITKVTIIEDQGDGDVCFNFDGEKESGVYFSVDLEFVLETFKSAGLTLLENEEGNEWLVKENIIALTKDDEDDDHYSVYFKDGKNSYHTLAAEDEELKKLFPVTAEIKLKSDEEYLEEESEIEELVELEEGENPFELQEEESEPLTQEQVDKMFEENKRASGVVPSVRSTVSRPLPQKPKAQVTGGLPIVKIVGIAGVLGFMAWYFFNT